MLHGHHLAGAPAEDGLRGVVLRMQRVDRDDRSGQAGERLQQVPHRGDLVRFRFHGGLPEDRADAVRQRRDQVRGFLYPCSGRRGRPCRRPRLPAGRRPASPWCAARHRGPGRAWRGRAGRRPCGTWTPPLPRASRPGRPARPGRRRRPTARSQRTTSILRSPPRSPRPAARPAGAGARASYAGPGPGQGDQEGSGCGQPG